MSRRSETDAAASAAMLSAAAMIAHQVGGKATRDALFLSNFDVTALPLMLIGASLFSIVVVLAASRAMPAFTPAKLIPRAFAVSGLDGRNSTRRGSPRLVSDSRVLASPCGVRLRDDAHLESYEGLSAHFKPPVTPRQRWDRDCKKCRAGCAPAAC